MIHPDTQLVTINDVVGSGVIATRRIPRGTVTWVMDALDRFFIGNELNALPPSYDKLVDHWTFHDGRNRRVLCWDLGRYLNHSCEPNCAGSEFLFEVALRDIEAGEQLTNDYATLYMGPNECFACSCGTPTCRGAATHELQSLALESVNSDLRLALGEIGLVSQPLGALLQPNLLQRAQDALLPAVYAAANAEAVVSE